MIPTTMRITGMTTNTTSRLLDSVTRTARHIPRPDAAPPLGQVGSMHVPELRNWLTLQDVHWDVDEPVQDPQAEAQGLQVDDVGSR